MNVRLDIIRLSQGNATLSVSLHSREERSSVSVLVRGVPFWQRRGSLSQDSPSSVVVHGSEHRGCRDHGHASVCGCAAG